MRPPLHHRNDSRATLRKSTSPVAERLERRTLLSAYTIVDLGPEIPAGINDQGEVTGQTLSDSAFIYLNGATSFLHAGGGHAINASGVVAGNTANNFDQGFFYDGSIHLIGGQTYVNAINTEGLIAGGRGSYPDFQPLIYSSAAQADVTPPELSSLTAQLFGINSAGDVVGVAPDATSSFLFHDGVKTDLPISGVAYAINDADAITGNNGNRAVLYSQGHVQDLPALGGGSGWGFAINNQSQVVGQDSGEAFVYSDGVMSDLNNLIPGQSGWHLDVADGINNSGQICGRGTLNGQTHGFLLTPISVPTTLQASSVSATYGGTVMLSATLAANGQPLPSQMVSFSVEGTVIGTATTDQYGVATVAYSLGTLAVGNYPVQATFAGGSAYQASTATSALTITDQNLQGMVWADFNNDGSVDFGEQGISGVAISLTNSAGEVIGQTTTDANGLYAFNHVPPDTYTITEGSNAAGYVEGKDSLGTITDLRGGVISTGVGGNSVQDVFSSIPIAADHNAINYNFGEQPAPGSSVSKGQSAGIGFWNNKNGQALILKFSSIGQWLADTLPQTFGSLAGDSPQQVAMVYQQQFVLKDKLDAQFMATALNVYATDQSLGGTYAASYGFSVGQYGLGDSTWNVGSDGAAFGVVNNSTLTVLELVQNWDQQTNKSDSTLRKMALDLFGGINSKGGI